MWLELTYFAVPKVNAERKLSTFLPVAMQVTRNCMLRKSSCYSEGQLHPLPVQ